MSILAPTEASWQHHAMIECRTLSDDHPDLAHSSPLRAGSLTHRHALDLGAIGMIQAKAFQRVFVHWEVGRFD